MSVEIIQERLASYGCASTLEEEQALREITQEIILAGLGRTNLFARAAFQGGTCLRIFHSLNRFSEDLDFALDAPDAAFQLPPYLDRVCRELTVYGYEFEIDDRSKAGSAVQQAFVKDDSVGKLLRLDKQLRITKAGNSHLRRLLITCAQYILGPFAPESDLRHYGERIAARGGKNAKRRAVVAVARKLAVLLHRLWADQSEYIPVRSPRQEAA